MTLLSHLGPLSRLGPSWHLRRAVTGIGGTLFGVVTSLALLHLITAGTYVVGAFQRLDMARRIESVNLITNDVLQAAQHYALERGRTNAVLNDSRPVSAESRAFIDRQRAAADAAMAQVFARLPAYRIDGTAPLLAALDADRAALAALRQRADGDLALERSRRDPALVEAWFPQISAMIERIDGLLAVTSHDISTTDGRVAWLSAVKINAWGMRNYAGRESARLAAAIAAGTPMSMAGLQESADLRARVAVYWTAVRRIADGIREPRLDAALAEVERVYFGRFGELRDQVRRAAESGSPYPVSIEQFAAVAVPALESLVGIMDAAVAVTDRHAEDERIAAGRALRAGLFLLAAVVTLMVAVFLLVSRRVTAPLRRLTGVMHRLARGDLGVAMPAAGRRDEIGLMAEAVAVFRSNAIELEAARLEAEAARRAAETANLAKSRFLATMSHELRTPLNAILGFSEIIRDQSFGPAATAKYAEYAADIHRSGHHLLALINDILDISKIEAGKIEIAPRLLEIEPLLGSSVHLVEERAERRGLRLSLDLAAAPAEVFADERALLQIIFNLLSNSIKFTAPGGSVTVAARSCEGGGVDILVADTGIGIPADQIERVQRPFEQIDNHYSRSEGGTGLGLALVKALTELHGGRLEIASTVNVGTTVTVRLPAPPPSAEPA